MNLLLIPSHASSLAIQVPCLLGFIIKRRFFSPNHLIRLGGFLPTISLSNNHPHLSIFPLQFPAGLGGFFIDNCLLAFSLSFSIGLEGFEHRSIYWFFSLFSHWVERFFFTLLRISTHLRAWRSSRPRRKAIVRAQARDLSRDPKSTQWQLILLTSS